MPQLQEKKKKKENKLSYGSNASKSGVEILKNSFILRVSIKIFKYLVTKIEFGPPKCLS